MAKKRTKDSYPVMGANGKVFNAPVYQDDNNRAYIMDGNGHTYYVERQNTFDHPVQLDDVNVYAPSPQQMLDKALSNYSTISNDRTKANNTLHRRYNPHLNDNAQRGAISHNTWTQEHPNLDAWGYVPSAAVLATAAYPFAAGVGSTLAGTEVGQAVRYGANTLLNNPLVNAANTAAGYGFGVRGLYDISHGKFTPFTALDLAGFYPAAKSIDNIVNPKGFKADFREMYYRNPTKEELRLAEEYPDYANLSAMRDLERKQLFNNWADSGMVTMWEQNEELRNAEREAAERLRVENQAAYENTAREEQARRAAEERENINSISDNNIELPFEDTVYDNLLSTETYNNIINSAPSTIDNITDVNITAPAIAPILESPSSRGVIDNVPLNAVDSSNISDASTIIANSAKNAVNIPVKDTLEAPRIEDFANTDDYWDAVFAYDKANKKPILTRDVSKGERRYTREEVQDWLSEVSDPYHALSIRKLDNGRKIDLAYGDTGAHGKFYLGQEPGEALQLAVYPAEHKLADIRDANKFDNASGILFHTYSGDTSIDSTPLLYAMMTRAKAKGFVPIGDEGKTITTNSFGVRSYFPGNNHPMMKRAKKLFDSDKNAKGEYVFDENGDAIGIELEDADGKFTVPMNSADEILERTNRNIRRFNEKYGTSYPEAVWQTKFDGSKKPHNLGNRMVIPSPFGIFYEQGGPINKRKRKLMTQL